ncbi:Pet127-domain-containing protein [Hypoxylon sp. FL1284]|nr:Pet127-domain-containing protein [Hypoxylon sp. FL1284]
MLQLSGRGIHRIGTSYICASCLAASHPPRLLALHPTSIPSCHGRPLTSTRRRPATATQASTPDGNEAQNIPKKEKEKKKSEKARASGAPLSKKAASREGGDAHQLKNVLSAQNINVDEIVKNSQTKQDAKGNKAKTKAKAKSKQGTKPAKAAGKAEAASGEVAAKGDLNKNEEPKDAASTAAATAKGEPTKGEPTRAKSTAGRLRKVASSASGRRGRPRGPPHTKADIAALKETLEKLDPDDNKAGESTKPLSMSSIAFSGKARRELLPRPYGVEAPPAAEALDGGEKSEESEKKNIPIDKADRHPVPSLSYGLDRVLFNPGVYHLQDPRSRVYNFDPYLSEIMPIREFDFNALKQYVTSSKDTNLIRIAKEHGKKYTGSTSSMTSMLSHFHYLLSSWREVNAGMMSRGFQPESSQFTRILRSPAAVFLHWKDGTYAIDADKEYDTANVLSMLGKSMEKLLTVSKEEYERYRHINSDQITEEERNAEEAYHYTGFGDFMMRSQLDAHDPRVPGSGMFDLKTRAVISIRMDAKGFHKGLGYEIRSRLGQWESFEREYFDMIRSAFLKYSLQVRMGRMDGIFVAFHNTQRIFGFQYIPLEDMDLALHGTSDKSLGNKEYMLSLSLLNNILDRAAKRFPEQSLRLHFETRTSVSAPFMYVFAKPVTQADIDEVQNANRASIEAFEREMLGIVKDEVDAETESVLENEDTVDDDEDMEETPVAQETSSLATWKEVRQMVEDAVDDDELGVGAVREAIEDSLEQSGLLHVRSSTEARGYVDALLSAITGDYPTDPAEPSLGASMEDIVADGDGSLSTSQGIENSGLDSPVGGQSVHSDKESTQSQMSQTGEERSEADTALDVDQSKVSENDDKSTAQSATIDEQDSGHAEATEPTKDKTPEVDQSVDIAALEQPPVVDSDTTVSVSEESREEADEEEVEEEETEDADDEVEAKGYKKVASGISTMSPLRDLIVRMARRLDEKAVWEEADSPLDDSSKLKEFERILGELIARSKEERAQIQEETRSEEKQAQVQEEPHVKEPAQVQEETHPEEEQTQAQKETTSSEPDTQEKSQTEGDSESGESQPEVASNAEEPSPQPSTGEGEQAAESKIEEDPNLLGMVLTIKNKVNNKYVTRPENLTKKDVWTVEYNVEEMDNRRAQTIYHQCRGRRQKVLGESGNRDYDWYNMFGGQLEKRTLKGRKFRATETMWAKNRPVHIMGHDGPLTWEEVFERKSNAQDAKGQDGAANAEEDGASGEEKVSAAAGDAVEK